MREKCFARPSGNTFYIRGPSVFDVNFLNAKKNCPDSLFLLPFLQPPSLHTHARARARACACVCVRVNGVVSLLIEMLTV